MVQRSRRLAEVLEHTLFEGAGSAPAAVKTFASFLTRPVVFPASAVLTRKETHAAVQKLVRVGGVGHWWLPAAAHSAVLRDGLDLLT
jgi:hypothetical protein|eukprot:m.43534 g.43534  ORF g.43534 m.43534 type:complete len:87 (-) comp14748_c0_seq1:471-731(-)